MTKLESIKFTSSKNLNAVPEFNSVIKFPKITKLAFHEFSTSNIISNFWAKTIQLENLTHLKYFLI